MNLSITGNYLKIVTPLKRTKSIFALSIFGLIIGLFNIFQANSIYSQKLSLITFIWYCFSYLFVFLIIDDISLFLKIRFFLISILSFIEAIFLSFNINIHLAPMASWLITNDMRFVFITAGIIASSSTLIGWILPYLIRIRIPRYRIKYYLSPILVSYICLFLGILYFISQGGFLTQNNIYGSKNSFDIGLSVLNIFQAFCLSYILVFPASFKDKRNSLYITFISFILGPLGGSRADFVIPIFLLFYILYKLTNNKSNVKEKKTIYKILLKSIFLFFSLFIIYFILIFVSVYRANPNIVDTFFKLFGQNPLEFLFQEQFLKGDLRNIGSGLYIINFETGGLIANTFYGGLITKPFENYPELGISSYLNWFNNILPRFFGFSRVAGLEYFLNPYVDDFSLNIISMTKGGVHEITEAFLNFGYFGTFVVPLIWSTLFSTFEKNIIKTKELYKSKKVIIDFYAFISVVFLIMSFRGIFYQNFTYFRAITIIILMVPFIKRFQNESF